MKIKESLSESFKSPLFNLLAIANLSLIAIAGLFPMYRFSRVFALVALIDLPSFAVSWFLAPMRPLALVPPLIYLQWIAIGACAKLAASRIELSVDQTVLSFHLPRLNINAATTASAENASVMAQNIPCGPKP